MMLIPIVVPHYRCYDDETYQQKPQGHNHDKEYIQGHR